MYKQTCTNLLELPPGKVKEWLDGFDAVITDCDGVLWVYSNVIEGAVDTMNRFKTIGKKIFFCTNNSTKTRQQLLEKSHSMGFDITAEGMISSAHSTAAYLKARDFQKKVYVIGAGGITGELDAVGIKHSDIGPDVMNGTLAEYLATSFCKDAEIGAVVVGFDEHFSFCKMIKAASYLDNPECLFIATNTDERFPMPGMVIPGSGSFVRAVQTCAEREPFVIGKPNPSICEWLINEGTIDPARTLMIGDRCNTDILLGFNCGFQTLLVGTGIHKLNDVEAWKNSDDPEQKKLIPDVFLPKLGDLLPFM
ncbi:glycerol-3-phosphate phosphatase-like isoform X1 [Rhagoletis pomonella]|uniref:glycerol-3-phosphate phosphatase-like isoform X1 n=2 Tax=Rhagoletis pomonella TaxID=28610 RepID=UPI00178286FF|nr:glycerol-3-phosphate phosphatase-like isoform X1 [Rhagoletis pomonella]XP_036326663.1 glycerol-3-phosphate phosphatase-like isoform X1 [Rhagoletis pomonella]